MAKINSKYDAAIIGAGHNGLVAAAYLGRAGLSVLMLERNPYIGGATLSSYPFAGVEAKLSVYSYLISLFPQKIVDDLGLSLRLRSRGTASYTPGFDNGNYVELLVSNTLADRTRKSFEVLTGGTADYRGYLKLQAMRTLLAKKLWPTLLDPLRSKADLKSGLSREERQAWDAYIENPIGNVIEEHISNDLIRGMLFTDAKIGVSTYPHDPTFLQNLTYLYHIIGRESGEWCVPVGGMGTLASSLKVAALESGATIISSARIDRLELGEKDPVLRFETDTGMQTVEAGYALCNAAPVVLNRLTGTPAAPRRAIDEGSVVKINLLLKRLPRLRSGTCSSREAFEGTFHIDEGYDQMTEHYRQAAAGVLADRPSGEMYCHSLTDDSILSDHLNAQGHHTLTLFGLDMPYAIFAQDNERLRAEVLQKYLSGINQFTLEPIQECIAEDAYGKRCIEIKTPVDLEREIHLPRGNIFHNALSWPFAEKSDEVGTWGVETNHPKIFICGSGARRGGGVSGIPGHNAAMKVLGQIKGARDRNAYGSHVPYRFQPGLWLKRLAGDPKSQWP
jgi:phytoene dehydrogenase-like protein